MAFLNRRLLHPLRCILATQLLILHGTAVQAQVDWSREVLAERDTDEKERIVCVRGTKEGVSADVIATLIKREKHGSAVAAAAGQYFEKGELDTNTPGVLMALAQRPDIGAQAIAYASVSTSAPELIVGFASAKNDDAQLVAARMLAATAVMRGDADRQAKRLPDKIGDKSVRLNVNYRDQIVALLESDDELVLEYTLHAAAIDRVSFAKDAIAKHQDHKDPAVAMAAQYALASVNGEINAAAVLEQINEKPKATRGKKADTPPALTYETRGTPRTYAIMAAGMAKLSDASDPLMALLGDQDMHVAVEAARALGHIGSEGIALKLLGVMTDEMPWPVRLAMYDAIGANPDKAAIAPLRESYTAEDGRLRQDALFALLSIVAGKPEAMTIDAFDNWWALNGEAFVVDVKATNTWRAEHSPGQCEVQPIAGFYDSAVISDRPVFAVDASLSMKGKQIESLQSMLETVVLGLPNYVKFNIVDFGGHVRTLAPGGMIPAENRKAAMEQFKYEMELTLGTRTYDAVERAILIPGMDSVHFLSDGAPYGSHLASWVKIDYVTRLLCRTTPVAVNVIFFPEPGKEEQAAKSVLAKQMQAYAEAHAGKFVVSVAE